VFDDCHVAGFVTFWPAEYSVHCVLGVVSLSVTTPVSDNAICGGGAVGVLPLHESWLSIATRPTTARLEQRRSIEFSERGLS
jgi:hypothetical protein